MAQAAGVRNLFQLVIVVLLECQSGPPAGSNIHYESVEFEWASHIFCTCFIVGSHTADGGVLCTKEVCNWRTMRMAEASSTVLYHSRGLKHD